MELLTTGVYSGLGKYIYENLGGIGLTRYLPTEEREQLKGRGADIIIHCAANSSRGITSDSLYPYFEDNVLLTKEVVTFPHKKFIYISSVDVYPKNTEVHSEDELIDIDYISGIYGITKLISESVVKNHCDNYLILRSSAFLGKYSRMNSLIKVIEDKECTLSLSDNSILNCVLHSDALDFIKLSIDSDLKGICNLASSENITLSEVADMLGKKVKFGAYFYNVGNINNSKASSVFPAFKKTTKEVINQFIEVKK